MASTDRARARPGRSAAVAAVALAAALTLGGPRPADAAATPTEAPAGSCGSGQIVGGYLDASGKVRGLMLDKGRFTAFDAAGATTLTGAFDINERRQIVGVFR